MEEETLKRSGAEVRLVKQENRADTDGEDAGKVGNKRKTDDEENSSRPPNRKNLRIIKQEDQLESAKAQMCVVRDENEKLKVLLDSIVKEHQSLQTHLFEIVQQEQSKNSTHTSTSTQAEESHDLVFLSLGRSSVNIKKEEKSSNLSKSKESEDLRVGLALGLDSKFEVSTSCSAETSSNPSFKRKFNDSKEDETREQWAPSEENQVAPPQTLAKKIRVSVRARCDGPTMNDGCQWRKYGQKISKGNPCPRAYYRCTVGPTCPVRKQVQRCAGDMSILTTTYEGTHNHPLPLSATAMASTTSAAACMQMSGSTSSCSTPATSNISTNNHHSLNFSLSDNYRPRQLYSTPTFSSLLSHPTITLDLTTPSSSSSASLYAPSQFNRYNPTSLNFSSVDTSVYPSYGTQQPYNNSNLLGPSNLGTQHQNYFPYMPNIKPPPSQHSFSTENIAAATKAITSDPSFQTALEAAITSIVGSGADRIHGSKDREENRIGNSLKWAEPFQVNSTYSSSSINWNGCAPSYMNTSSSSSKLKEGSLLLLPPPSLPISSTKSASQSPVEDKNNMY